jgi:hypothetical protein
MTTSSLLFDELDVEEVAVVVAVVLASSCWALVDSSLNGFEPSSAAATPGSQTTAAKARASRTTDRRWIGLTVTGEDSG